MAAVAVLSGKAKLPSEQEMRAEYKARVAAKGFGRHFHSLREREEYGNELLAWVGQDITALGGEPRKGNSGEWLVAKAEQRQRLKFLFAKDLVDSGEQDKAPLVLPLCG